MRHGKEAENIPGFLLWQVSKLWQRTGANTLKRFNLASTQFVILGNTVRLTEEGKEVTQIVLSEATRVDPMSISQIIRALERKMLIQKINHPTDKRVHRIVPTEKGRALVQDIIPHLAKTHTRFFSKLGKDLPQFAATLQLLIDNNKTYIDMEEDVEKKRSGS
jgi:DNA-binding MarR family transcriptional regulator